VPASLSRADGERLQSSTQDVSAQGAAVRLASGHGLVRGDRITLSLKHRGSLLTLRACITATTPRRLRMRWIDLTDEQQQALVESTFARRDAWSSWAEGRPRDRLLASLFEVLAIGLAGYRRLARHALDDALRRLRPTRRKLHRFGRRIAHVLARPPAYQPGQPALLAALSTQPTAAATRGAHG